jgi:hypothetical protein
VSKRQKTRRRVAHANRVWERRQLETAAAWQRLHNAWNVIEENKDELTPEAYAEASEIRQQREQFLRKYITDARDRYVASMDKLGAPPVPMVGTHPEEEVDWSLVVAKEEARG